jgi:hypothetical protein
MDLRDRGGERTFVRNGVGVDLGMFPCVDNSIDRLHSRLVSPVTLQYMRWDLRDER